MSFSCSSYKKSKSWSCFDLCLNLLLSRRQVSFSYWGNKRNPPALQSVVGTGRQERAVYLSCWPYHVTLPLWIKMSWWRSSKIHKSCTARAVELNPMEKGFSTTTLPLHKASQNMTRYTENYFGQKYYVSTPIQWTQRGAYRRWMINHWEVVQALGKRYALKTWVQVSQSWPAEGAATRASSHSFLITWKEALTGWGFFGSSHNLILPHSHV